MRSEILSDQADGRWMESDRHVSDGGNEVRPGAPALFDDVFERAH